MKEINKAAKVKDADRYFLRRNGGWFRVGAKGYTDDLAQAGEFSAGDARGHMQAEGVTAVPLYEARNAIWKEMQASLERSSKLAALYNHVTGFP